MAYSKEKKQFHPVRHIRLSEENMQWLEKIKKGTWNHTFNLIKQKYGEVEFQKLSDKKAKEENDF